MSSLAHDDLVDVTRYWQDRARLAEAQVTIVTSEAVARQGRLIEILQILYRQLEDNFDVVDGSDGQPRPNRWMSVGNELEYECRKLGIDVTKE